MANDTSGRPHELLNLKIIGIVFKKMENGIQYAEVLVTGKTKSRTLPLISLVCKGMGSRTLLPDQSQGLVIYFI